MGKLLSWRIHFIRFGILQKEASSGIKWDEVKCFLIDIGQWRSEINIVNLKIKIGGISVSHGSKWNLMNLIGGECQYKWPKILIISLNVNFSYKIRSSIAIYECQIAKIVVNIKMGCFASLRIPNGYALRVKKIPSMPNFYLVLLCSYFL